MSALSIGAVALTNKRFAAGCGGASPKRNLGVQLWSVRDDLQKDAPATLRAIAKMGYELVEGFGWAHDKVFGRTPAEFARLVRDNGLRMPAVHCGFSLVNDYLITNRQLSDRAKRAVDAAAQAGGLRYVVWPWLEPKERAEVKSIVEMAKALGQYVKQAGLRFAYHNHDFEFEQAGPDGRVLYDWLLTEVDPALLDFEIDLYWVKFAGKDPLQYFNRHPGRFHLCHLKDMARTEKRETVEVGDGSINFSDILAQRDKAGLEYYIVELEHYRTTPLQGVERARQNFLKLKY
jgi:sugar phosphate isomerase/epimerase